MLRRLNWLLLALIMAAGSGCYSFTDRVHNAQQDLIIEKNLRLLREDWVRAWLMDSPSRLQPYQD